MSETVLVVDYERIYINDYGTRLMLFSARHSENEFRLSVYALLNVGPFWDGASCIKTVRDPCFKIRVSCPISLAAIKKWTAVGRWLLL